MKRRGLMIALLASALMAQTRPLANGVYAIEEGGTKAKNPVIRQYEGKDFVLNAANFAPLKVEGKPQVNRDARGSWLMIQLTSGAAKRLEELTRSQMDRPVAVVVGDRILSTPAVRSVISDGKARLTPCAEESCETLLRQLSK